ncbi:MAG: hypothetical protein OXN84_02570 [Albidovulum sp.]|nr:hypothetical protein [Albidovulum sp.]
MNVPARAAEGLVIRSAKEWREIVEDFEREGVTAAASSRWRCRRSGRAPAELAHYHPRQEAGIVAAAV